MVGTVISLFFSSFAVLFVMYFIPALFSLRPLLFPVEYLPEYFKLTLIDFLLFLVVSLFRIFFLSIFIAVLLMPPAFLGSLLLESIMKMAGKKGFLAFYPAVFVSSFIWSGVVLLIFPFLPLGLFYLVFFAG